MAHSSLSPTLRQPGPKPISRTSLPPPLILLPLADGPNVSLKSNLSPKRILIYGAQKC